MTHPAPDLRRVAHAALSLTEAPYLNHYCRGRGFGAVVIRAALTHAAANGCTSASLRSGPKSVPLYERLGFRYVCPHRTYAAPPA